VKDAVINVKPSLFHEQITITQAIGEIPTNTLKEIAVI
jgi:hypothetical protein